MAFTTRSARLVRTVSLATFGKALAFAGFALVFFVGTPQVFKMNDTLAGSGVAHADAPIVPELASCGLGASDCGGCATSCGDPCMSCGGSCGGGMSADTCAACTSGVSSSSCSASCAANGCADACAGGGDAGCGGCACV